MKLPGEVSFNPSKKKKQCECPNPSTISCRQNISKTLLGSTVVPHNLQHLTKDKAKEKTKSGKLLYSNLWPGNHKGRFNKNGRTSLLAFSFVCQWKSVQTKVKTTFKFLQHRVHALQYINVMGSRNLFPILCLSLYNLWLYVPCRHNYCVKSQESYAWESEVSYRQFGHNLILVVHTKLEKKNGQ